MGKIIQTLALVIMLILFPPAALITVSGNAVPGDLMYPIKRGLENTVLFLASFNPYTKAYFAAAQSDRRYKETASLLSKGDNADASLQSLVDQTSQAALDINSVKNANQKTKLIADLSDSIEKYDQGLNQAQQQMTRNTLVTSPQTSTPNPTSRPTPQASPGAPGPSIFQPTPTPSAGVPNNDELRRRQEAIERARRELEELRRRLEEEQKILQMDTQQQSQPSPTPLPSRSPSPSPSPSRQTTQLSPEPSGYERPRTELYDRTPLQYEREEEEERKRHYGPEEDD